MNISIGNKKIDTFFLLVCFLWGYESMFRYVFIIIERIPFVGTVMKSTLPIVILVVLIMLSANNIFMYVSKREFVFVLFTVLFSVITLLVGSVQTQAFKSIASVFLLKTLPMLFVGKAFSYKLTEKKEYFDTLVIISALCICTHLFFLMRNGGGTFEASWTSSQYASYFLLPHLLLLVASLFDRFTPIKMGVSLLGAIDVSMQGNRGSIICFLLILPILTYYKSLKMKTNKRIWLILAVIIVCVVVSQTYISAFTALCNYASLHGFSTRTFSFFLGTLEQENMDSGRSTIIETLLVAIKENSFGYGLTGDQYLTGWYSHNLFVELLVELGVLVGGAIIIFIIVKIIKAVIIAKENWNVGKFFYALLCCGFVKLFISGTYLTEPYFFAFMGFSLGMIEMKKYYGEILGEDENE